MPDARLLFVLNVDTNGLAAEVRVNDITVYSNRGKQATFAEKINPLVFSGTNVVTVSLAQLPRSPADSKPQPPPRQEFSLTVQRGEQGTDPGEDGIILRYRWSPGGLLTPSGSEVFRENFDAGTVEWRPRWTTLPPVRATEGELQNFVVRLADSLRNRELERVLALYAQKFRELANALDLDQAGTTETFQAYLRSMMFGANWSVDPVVVRRLRYREEANGRIVRVTSDIGAPPIMTHGSKGDIPFAVNVSRIDGKLWIIR